MQKRFMNRLGADKQLALFGYRVGLAAAELSDREMVPWSSRDPTTQALALIYGVMHIHKVNQQSLVQPLYHDVLLLEDLEWGDACTVPAGGQLCAGEQLQASC